MNIFVAGATGAVGRPMVDRLLQAGHTVAAITRSEARCEELQMRGVKAIVLDVFDRDKLRQAVIEAQPEVLINQLTSIPKNLDVRRMAQEFMQTNRLRTEGAQILMEVAVAAGARRVIAQSYGAFYAPDKPGLATEEDPLYLDAPAAFVELVRAVERLEHTVLNTPGISGSILRYGHFYGPGTGYAIRDGAIADTVRRRQMPILGGGNGVFSFIHVEDAAEATLHALQNGEPGIYNIVDDDPAPLHEWAPVYTGLLGAPPPMRLPKLLGRLVAGRYAVYFMDEMRGASNQKAKRQLGWQPRYASWREGFRAEV